MDYTQQDVQQKFCMLACPSKNAASEGRETLGVSQYAHKEEKS